MHVNDLLTMAVNQGASDLHLKAGSYPMARIHGLLTAITQEIRLDHENLVEMAASIVHGAAQFKDSQEVDRLQRA